MAEPTFNDKLFDLMVGHQTGLLRYSGTVRNQIWKALDSTEADLKRQIKAATKVGLDSPARVRRLNKLLEELKETRLTGWREARPEWFQNMRDLSKSEPVFLSQVIGTAVPVEIGAIFPTTQALNDIVTSTPFLGKTLKGWADNVQRADLSRIEDQVKIGLIQNETMPQISRRIVGTVAQRGRDGVTQVTRNQAASLARTITSGVSSEARQKYLELNKDLSPLKLFTATLDARTTPICRRYDGSKWEVDDPKAPVFPLHFGERSLYSPILDGEVVGDRPRRDFTQRQLVREYAKENDLGKITGDNRANLPRGTKGSFDKWSRRRMRELTGTTPADTTYQVWLGRQSAAIQNDILGPTRGALFRRGGLQLDAFVMTDGTELTLSQLAKRHASAFNQANLDPSAFR